MNARAAAEIARGRLQANMSDQPSKDDSVENVPQAKEAFQEPQEDSPNCSSKRRTLANHAIEYCNTTSIHGFLYLVNSRYTIEKLFWACVLLTGFSLSSYIINQAYK